MWTDWFLKNSDPFGMGFVVTNYVWILITIILIGLIPFLYKIFIRQRMNIRNQILEYNTNYAIPKVKKLTSNSFKLNKFRNYCGIEIECIADSQGIRKEEAKEMHFNKGGDGSLSEGGVEFKSIPSRGDKLFKIIDKFCKELNDKKYYVDTTCGLHIHIETEQDLELLKKLYIFYSKYENLFFKMLPKSRQKSDYCEKFKEVDEYSISKIKKVNNLEDFKKLYYDTNSYGSNIREHDHKKRHCWCNFHSVFYRGTLEIRNHSGTINSEKIKKWILIHLYVKDFLKNRSIDYLNNLPNNRETFLEIFPLSLRKYIRQRWDKFPTAEENKFQEVKNVPNTSALQIEV